MSQYPSCFPDDFETDILPKGIHAEEKKVYRVMKKGIIDREAFISTFEETKRGLRPPGRKPIDERDPSLYSTSCNEDIAEAQCVLGLLSGHHPAAVIAEGVIHPSCGPWQLTSERENDRQDTHVDWWVYENSQPQVYFNEVKKDGA